MQLYLSNSIYALEVVVGLYYTYISVARSSSSSALLIFVTLYAIQHSQCSP